MSHSAIQLLASWGLPTFTWVMMWSVLAILTVLLLVLLRTRWSKSKPWRRYAVLSLWVHVLLACATMTVRIVTGAPDSGEGEMVRVTVLNTEMFEDEQHEPAELPEWELPTSQEIIAPELTPLEESPPEPAEPTPDSAAMEQLAEMSSEPPPSPAPPLEAPTLMAPPPADASTESAASKVVETSSDKTLAKSNEPKEKKELAESAADVVPKKPAPPSVPQTYQDRFAENRQQIAESGGGSAQTEKAVHAALKWLAAAQSANGGWDASRFGAGKEQRVLGEDRRGAGRNADTGVTGLALLAFLGSGNTHRHGAYTSQVADGLEYLRQRQRSDGALFGDAQVFARMYCHSMATFAVCEALALTGDERLKPVAEAAVRYTLAMQHPTDGGWRYRRGDTGDTSQLGWQLMTLKSAELAELPVPASTWSLVERYLRRVRRGNTGGLASYRPEAPASRTMTAEAMFCRQLLRATGYGGISTSELHEALRVISQQPPADNQRNLYYWYYATLALHQAKEESTDAADTWDDWNHSLTTVLLTTQQEDGSWSADTTWGGYGGRVYTTALSAMCLEVYYRYLPAQAPGPVARRPWQAVPY